MRQPGDAPAPVEIVQADVENLEDIVPLFEAYRAFYGHSPDPERARSFLGANLLSRNSVIFLAYVASGERAMAGRDPAGFTQLFPSFTTGAMRRIWILNDLFIAPPYRRFGVGRRLLERARTFAVETGAVELTLETQTTNHAAQALYESLGWVRDRKFYTYHLAL